MDPEQNPYTPDAGTRPPALVGRDKVLKEFTMIYRRAMNGHSDKALVMAGLRGVGKTVLLNEFKSISNSEATVLISIEIPTEDGKFLSLFAEKCRQALFQMSERERWTARALAAARTLASFSLTFEPSGAVSVKLGVDRAEGKADSGELDSDLGDLICSLGEAARDHGKILLILIDEIQNLSTKELIAIVTAKHQINQGTLPVLLIGAGMPNMPALIGAAPKYSERMFSFPPIGKLDPLTAGLALTEPANALSVEIEEDAVKYIVQYTEGYPFFLQEFGKAVWDLAPKSPITLQDAQTAQVEVEDTLDRNFFSVRFNPLPKGEKEYLRALAGLGPGEHTQAEVATAMGKANSKSTGARVSRLSEKGIIYKLADGKVSFTIPHLERYVMRNF